MPNYYAHLLFGAKVLSVVPEPVRARLERQRDAYTLGQYGPDPLFFYHPVTNNKARVMGMGMHKQPVRPVMERLRRAVESGVPWAEGYAGGFLCHFALDSRCHEYVERLTAEEQATHAGIESEFDRFLMVRNGIDPFQETPLAIPPMPENFDLLLERYAYPGIKADHSRKGLKLYQAVSRWYTRTAGNRPVKGCVDMAAKKVSAFYFFRDVVLERKPRPVYQRSSREMLAILQGEVAAAAEQIAVFFSGAPLGPWFDRDFSNRPCPTG